MTEATVFQAVQIGVESQHGSPVAADLILPTLELEPQPQGNTTELRASGRKTPRGYLLNSDHMQSAIKGGMTYNEIVYLLASLFDYSAPTLNTTLSYTWPFGTDDDGEDVFASYTIEHGSGQARRWAYNVLTGLDITFKKNASPDGSGTMIGQEQTEGITRTESPTEIAVVPILPTHLTVYVADTAAGLDAADACGSFEVKWSTKDRRGPVWTLDASEASFTKTVEKRFDMTMEVLLEADAAGMALLENLRDGETKFIRIEAIGAEIETGYYYELTIDMAGQVKTMPALADAEGVYAVRWTMGMVHDETWGKGFEATVVNTLGSLSDGS